MLVMLEAIPYRGLMQRHQHLARELSRYLPVIYCEETPSRIRHIFNGRPFDPALSGYKKGLVKVGEGIYVFKAPPCVPRWMGYRRSSEETSKRTAASLKPLLPGDKKVILWLSSPYAVAAIGLYDEIISIFDCFDAFGEFPGEERYRKEIVKAVHEISHRVDVTLATSEELKRKLKPGSKRVEVIKNACDFAHFANKVIEPEVKLLNIENINYPLIGYMGDVAPWLDVEVLKSAAMKNPNWSFLILGTWKVNKNIISHLKNVYAPGWVSYDDLPYYARKFNIGLIPFKLTELTRVVNPLKLYEYFALGIPVVASNMPEISQYEDIVYIYGTSNDFSDAIIQALEEPFDSPKREQRRDVAKKNSWENRARDIVTILEDVIENKNRSCEGL